MGYKIIYQENSKIKKRYLTNEEFNQGDLPKNIIKIKKQIDFFDKQISSKRKISNKKLKKIFYELSIMLQSNIVLDEALSILIKNEKDQQLKKFLEKLKLSFNSSKNLEESLEEFRLDSLVKAFLSLTQNSSNTASNISILSKILTENHEIKKEFLKVLFYPMILVITFFSALIGIFNFVVPKFQVMFTQYHMELSFASKSLFFIKDIYENYLGLILIALVGVIVLFWYLYNKVKRFRYFIDKLFVEHLFLLSSLYKDKIFYELFFCMENLLYNRYKFYESLLKSKVLIDNQYLLDKINKIESLLKSGKTIEFSISQSKLFDELTLSLLRTGEVSNSLELTVTEIKTIYKKRFNDRLKLFSLALEPIFFVLIMALIIWIVLAIFVPLWSIGDVLKI